MKRWLSCAEWPKDVYSFGLTRITKHEHDTKEQAEAVCRFLEREGFGGNGLGFPIRTWTEQKGAA